MPKHLSRLLITFFCSCLFLVACGQKGPLYLPEKNSAETTQKIEDTKTNAI